jgi:hypothetical protein
MATSRPLIGKDLRFFVKTQSAFQTIAADYPAATDAIEPKSDGGLVVTPAQSFTLIGDEATGLAFAKRVIEQAHGVSWSSSILAYLSGTAGTAPDWEPLLLLVASLQDSGGGTTTADGTGSHSGNESTFGVASASGIAVGGWLSFVAGGQFCVRHITGVSGTDITVAPRIVIAGADALPANGATVTDCRSYSFDSAIDDDRAATLFGAWADYQARVVGAYAESATLTLTPNQAPTLAMQGQAFRLDQITYGLLDGAIDNSVTSVVVDRPIGPETMADEWYITIGTEIMQVTAVSADGLTLTVVRGALSSSAASHSDQDPIRPYRPSVTTTVNIPTGMCGSQGMIGQYPVRWQSLTLEVSPGNVALPQALGDCALVSGYIQSGGGTLRITGTLLLDRDGQRALRNVERREGTQVFAQIGSVDGVSLGVYAPTARINDIPVSEASDMLTVEITCECLATTTSPPAWLGLC